MPKINGPKGQSSRRPPLTTAHADVSLLTMTDVCTLTRMSRSWVHASVKNRTLPAPLKLGFSARWRAADIRAYLASLGQL